MSTSEDLVFEDLDGDGELEHLETIEDRNEDDKAQQEDGDDEEAEKIEPKKVKPKIQRSQQPKLNELTLRGPRGITALPSYFQRVKFKGKGYEQQDLNVLMKTYEYWCHRLFPKYPFDASIAQIEKLGTKKTVQNFIKRTRQDLDDPDLPEENEEEAEVQPIQQHDPFDALTDTPIEITEEIAERIRINQEKARKLREEKLRQIQEKTSAKLGESSQLSQDLFASENDNIEAVNISQGIQSSDILGDNVIKTHEGNNLSQNVASLEISQSNSSQDPINNVVLNEEHCDFDQISNQKSPNDNKESREIIKNIEDEDNNKSDDDDMEIDDILDQINSDQI